MSALSRDVNLLPKTELEQSAWGRGLKWAISTGRYILIVVELVVIAAFVSRFKLDRDLGDLSDSITGKKAVMEAAYASEQNFRLVQSRLDATATLLDSQIQAKEEVETVTSYLPPEASLTKLAVQPGLISITGRTYSPTGLAILLSRLTSDHKWKSVDLTEVLADPTQGIQFTLAAKK